MSRSSPAAGVLFWLMVLAGGLTLIPCLLLPPLYEYRAALAARAAAEKRLTDLENQLLTYQKQIDALQNDPAYLERLAWKELGIPTPGVTTLRIETEGEEADAANGASLNSAGAPASSGASANAADDFSTTAARAPDQKLATDAAAYSDRLMEYYPVLRVFVLDRTRPILMSLAGALLVMAVALLGFPRGLRRKRVSEAASAGK